MIVHCMQFIPVFGAGICAFEASRTEIAFGQYEKRAIEYESPFSGYWTLLLL